MAILYKTPLKKLVIFFRTSRDKWKEKTLQAKKELKLCKNRIKYLESSKAKLKLDLLSLKQEIQDIRSKMSNTASDKIYSSFTENEGKKYNSTMPNEF